MRACVCPLSSLEALVFLLYISISFPPTQYHKLTNTINSPLQPIPPLQHTGTNFCNVHDLYCDEAGCNPFYKLAYDEEEGKCTEAKASVCIA